jgi:hypothetical protein
MRPPWASRLMIFVRPPNAENAASNNMATSKFRYNTTTLIGDSRKV